MLCFSCNLFHIIYILLRWNLSWSQCVINIELRSMKYHLVCFPDFDKWHSNVLSDFGFDTLRQWTCCDFSGRQGFFFSSQSFFCCHFVFPNNHPLCNTFLFTFFLGILYLPKACLGCGTFQCFTREVAISFPLFRWWNLIPEGKLDHQKAINWTLGTWFPIPCSFKHGALFSVTVTCLCQIHWLTQLPWLHWQYCWAHLLSSCEDWLGLSQLSWEKRPPLPASRDRASWLSVEKMSPGQAHASHCHLFPDQSFPMIMWTGIAWSYCFIFYSDAWKSLQSPMGLQALIQLAGQQPHPTDPPLYMVMENIISCCRPRAWPGT